jgi:hypothetical protein
MWTHRTSTNVTAAALETTHFRTKSRRLFLVVLLCGALGGVAIGRDATAQPVEEAGDAFAAGWSELLAQWTTRDGRVRYAAWRRDEDAMARLRGMVEQVGRFDRAGIGRERELAFLMDAYNVLVIWSVLDAWPLTNVLQHPGFFDGRRHEVAGRSVTLNELEHEWIRPEFREPRVHFVLNCASLGCPPLRSEALLSSTLSTELERATREFVRASTRLDREAGAVHVSRLFDWFAEDFGPDVRSFVARYLRESDAEFVRDSSVEVVFDEYDWAINAR